MTNDEIIQAAVSDPQVLASNARSDGVVPSAAEMMSRAKTELQSELNALIARPQISRAILEKDYSLDLTASPDTTTDARGTLFELPDYIGTVLIVTVGDDSRPVRKFNNRDDFATWYNDSIGSSSTNNETECCLVYDRTTANAWRLLFSPGVGSNSTAKIHYIVYLAQPVQVAILPSSIHHLVLAGLKRRLTGGQLFSEYEKDVTTALKVMDPLVGGSSPMPLGRDDEAFNCRMSIAISGGDWSSWPSSYRRR